MSSFKYCFNPDVLQLYDLNLEFAICFAILWPLDGIQELYLFQEMGGQDIS